MSKQIAPINIWKNGEIKEAHYFDLESINDNLSSIAVFKYTLLEEISNDTPKEIINVIHEITNGNLIMSETDYAKWDNSNEAAYFWAAKKLGISIIE